MTEPKPAPLHAMIYPAMIKVMRQIRAIAKDRRNTQQGFDYRGVDDAYNVVHPLMSEAGIFTSSRIVNHQRSIFTTSRNTKMTHVVLDMEYKFYAEDGSYVVTEVVGEGMDMMDKASNKAMSVADKYAILQAFKIPTEETAAQDPDATSPAVEAEMAEERVVEVVEMISENQAKFLHILAQKLNVKPDEVKARFQIESFKDIPKERVTRVKIFILQKGAVHVLQVLAECETSKELVDIADPLIKNYPDDSKTREKYDARLAELIAKESSEMAAEQPQPEPTEEAENEQS